MKLSVKFLSFLLVLTVLLAGCATQGSTPATAEPTTAAGTIEPTAAAQPETQSDVQPETEASEMFTNRDYQTQYEDNVVNISLNGDSISSDSDAVTVSGTTVKITEEATYVFSGTLNDGMIVVDAADTAKLQLVLNGVSVSSFTSAPLYILNADKVFVTLLEGTENTLSNGGEFIAIDGNNIDGAVFSKQDLTFNGSGSLTVTSPAAHGIVCKDDLVFTGGSYTVNAASHALDVNDSIRITGASLSVDSGKDGLHAENGEDTSKGFVYIADGTVSIEAEGDGISASAYVEILDGNLQITAGGGSENGTKASSGSYGDFMGGGHGPQGGGGPMYDAQSEATASADTESTSMKGIKAGGNLQIRGGNFTVDSADDALHSNASVSISGGSFELASGDDGVHADETLNISGGSIRISESYEGLEGHELIISDGEITLAATDDGLNAAGGTDSSGMGGRDTPFGGMGGGMGGGMSAGDGSILISGGSLYINASGDGIDANGSLEITGGYIIVCGPTQGDTATLDYDSTGVISGGTFIGTGAANMAQSFSSSENQGVIAVQVGSAAAGTAITLTAADGSEILSYTPELGFNVVILSSPGIQKGESYTLTVGSQSEVFQAS